MGRFRADIATAVFQMLKARLPISQDQMVFMSVRLIDELGFHPDEAGHFAALMGRFRADGSRIFGPIYEGILDLNPLDPREALDGLGTALLSQNAPHRHGEAWQIRRKIHPDLVRPGAFQFSARQSYLWFPREPQLSLSVAYIEANGSARLSDKGDRLTLRLAFQDEWAWAFDEGRRAAENAWRVVLTELVQQGMVLEVVQTPSWPPLGPCRVPFLAAQPHVARALQFLGQGQYSDALAAYDEALRIDPYNPISFGNRAVCYRLLGLLPLALEDVNRAMALKPGDAANYANRSDVHRLQGRIDEALADAETAVRLNPGDAIMFVIRGKVLAALGRPDEARADYRKALQLEPQNASAQAELARLGG